MKWAIYRPRGRPMPRCVPSKWRIQKWRVCDDLLSWCEGTFFRIFLGRQLPLSYLDTVRKTYVVENYMSLFLLLWHRFFCVVLSYHLVNVTCCCKNHFGVVFFFAVFNLVIIKCVRNEPILRASVRYLLKIKARATTLDLVHHGTENAAFMLVPFADFKCHT